MNRSSGDADQRLIPVDPTQPRRRGRRRHRPRTDQLGATPGEVVAIAAQPSALVGLWAGLLVITAAWTNALGFADRAHQLSAAVPHAAAAGLPRQA